MNWDETRDWMGDIIWYYTNPYEADPIRAEKVRAEIDKYSKASVTNDPATIARIVNN